MFSESSGALITVHLEVEDEECSINAWYCTDNDSVPAPASAVLAVFRTTVEDALREMLSSTAYIVGYSFNPQSPNAAQRVDYPIGRLGGSSGMAPVNPSNVAAHFFFRQQEISQRTFRRLYLPGISESWCLDGQWDFATYEDQFTAFGNAMVEPLSGGGISGTVVPCVRHRTVVAGVPGPYEFYQVTFWNCSLRASHQRKRSIYQVRAFGAGTAEQLPDIGTPPTLTPIVPAMGTLPP